jgi:hypothetical protein
MKIKLILCFCLISTLSMAQSKSDNDFFELKKEIGINCSQLLSNLLSLNSNTNSSTPFGFHFAKHNEKTTIRLGFNFKLDNNIDLNSPRNQTLNDYNYGARFGLEKHKEFYPKRVMFNYGFDIYSQHVHSESSIASSFLRTTDKITIGTGPAFRLIYKLNKHIHFMTEASLYADYSFLTDKTTDNFTPPDIKKSNKITANLNYPTSFYVNFLF